MKKLLVIFCAILGIMPLSSGQTPSTILEQKINAIEESVVRWRRDLHQFPELSNREFRTAEKITTHLKSLNLEVRTGVAHTGVVALLRGSRPGPTVALRADMDALPVVERVDLPFASRERSTYLGQEVGVMHACGHDSHVAILMGVASVLSTMPDILNGNVLFIFQPAEEGAPPGEEGGAKMMVDQGILRDFGVDVIFGLHINSMTEVGKIRYKAGGTLAAADVFTIRVKGKQSHGSMPWAGLDPIVASAQIIMGLQTIISRQTELTKEAAVISVGKITSGVRNNIIPESAEMVGTIRTLDVEMQDIIHEKIRKTATMIGESSGCEVEVEIEKYVPVTYNDPELTRMMLPSLEKAAGEENVIVSKAVTGAEDFSFFANEVPGLFFFLGGMEKGKTPVEVAPHHTPDFYIDDSGLTLGVEALIQLTLDYMSLRK